MKMKSKLVIWKNLWTQIACVLLAAVSARGASTFSYTDQWTTGGQGVLRASNDTGAAVTNWTLEFDWGATITSVWNGSIQSKVGNHYVVINASWNGALATGAATEVGCVFNTSAPGVGPTNLVFSAGNGGGTGGGGSGGGVSIAPVITSATSASASVGYAFTYQITASGTPISFGATGLPAGLSVSASTGLISGKPTTAGASNVSISATNSAGTASASLSLVVTQPSQCLGDINGDGTVDSSDMGTLLSTVGMGSTNDLNGDGMTDSADIGVMLGVWGSCTPVIDPAGYDKMPTVEQRKIVGYYPNWGIYQKNFPVTKVRGDKVNMINYAFLIPLDRTMPSAWNRIVSSYRGWTYTNYAAYLQQPAGTTLTAGVGLFDEWADAGADTAAAALTMSPAYKTTSNFGQLQTLKAANSKLRTMISIGGWTLSTPFFSIARDAQKRADFAKSAVYVVKRYGFDGIDIDWEYPGGGGLEQNGIGDTATDGDNYLLLLRALRDELNKQTLIDGKTYYLSIAGPGGDTNISNMDPKKIAAIVDWINIMTYDFHGGWDAMTGLNAPMVNVDPNAGAAKWSIAGATDVYLTGLNGKGGVPASQLVLGVPFYGRGWNNVEAGASGTGLGQAGSEGTSPGLGETEFPYNSLFSSGVLAYSNGVFSGAGGYTRFWNATAQVPYLYSASAKKFITYDDAQSMGVKMNFANQKALGGTMFWEMSEDTDSATGTSLIDTVFAGMRLP